MAEDSSESPPQRISKRKLGCLRVFFAILIIGYLFYKFVMFHEREEIRQNSLLQATRDINLMLFAYANDNGGKYPEGKTSTEVFQKLIDGGYVSNNNEEGPSGPEIFYFPMPGKEKPTSKLLKPENVCWDVTYSVDVDRSPENLPTVYTTGYRVIYKAGGSAEPEMWPARTWWEWLTVADYPRGFIAVCHISNSTVLLKASPSGSITNFIAPIPNGFSDPYTAYRQLTPDGSAP